MPRRETYDLGVESSGLGECGGVGSRQTAPTALSDQWGKQHPCGVVRGGAKQVQGRRRGSSLASWQRGLSVSHHRQTDPAETPR